MSDNFHSNFSLTQISKSLVLSYSNMSLAYLHTYADYVQNNRKILLTCDPMSNHKNLQNQIILNHFSALGIYFNILDDKFISII